MPRSHKRVRIERGLYKAGKHFYVCATPPGGRSAVWRGIGSVSIGEARRQRDRFAAEVQGQVAQPASNRDTFGDLADRWLQELRDRLAADEISPRTFDAYESSLRVHVLPAFGTIRITAITPDMLVAWIRRMRAAGGAQHSIHNHWAVAMLVLRFAVRHGALSSNPGDRLTRSERPTPGAGSRRSLDAEEMGLLLEAAPDRYRLSIACGMFSGLRVSELLGLTWADIDHHNAVIRVRAQMGRDGRRRPLKTKAATREVVLMTALGHQLKEQRAASLFSQPRDLVFNASSGKTIGHKNLSARGLEKAVERAGLEGVTFHVLRHTFASILISEGHDPVFVSRQLGHASPAITLQVYAHLFDAARHAGKARDQLDARFGSLLT